MPLEKKLAKLLLSRDASWMRLFAAPPWEYPQGEAWILDEWETGY